MAKLTGILFDDVNIDEWDYEVHEAVVTKAKIAIDWKEEGTPFHLLAHSQDGGDTYFGNYGSPEPIKAWKMELTRYTSVNGTILLIARWHQTDNGNEGVCAFQLAENWE